MSLDMSAPVLAEPLVLGAADDPAERAADLAAASFRRHGVARVAPVGCADVAGTAIEPAVLRRIDQARRSGHLIPAIDREPLERAFGTGFGHVCLHTDATADALCRALAARAFTVDGHVFVEDGYRPGTDDGRTLLAHELAHVLQGENGVVRRYVALGRHREATVEEVLDKLSDLGTYGTEHFTIAADRLNLTTEGIEDVKRHGSFLDALLAFGVDAEEIKTTVGFYVDAPDRYYYSDVYWWLLDLAVNPDTPADFEPDWEPFPSIRLKYLAAGANVEQTYAPLDNGTELDLHPPAEIQFASTIATHLNRAEKGSWYVGLTQTVLSSWKAVTFVDENGQSRTITVWLDSPCYDGGGEHKPWYDNNSSRVHLDRQRQDVDVELTDQPGMTIPKTAGETLHSVEGHDLFKTYLAVRHEDGSIGYMYYWQWRIVYDTHQCVVEFVDEGGYPDGQDAVLDGPRAGEACQIHEELGERAADSEQDQAMSRN